MADAIHNDVTVVVRQMWSTPLTSNYDAIVNEGRQPIVFDWSLQGIPQSGNFPASSYGVGDRVTMRWASLNAVIVIAGVFCVITLSTTAALVIFCRKKNIVFAFQQSDQETSEPESFELQDIGVVIETRQLMPTSLHGNELAVDRPDICVTDISDCEEDIDDGTEEETQAFLNHKHIDNDCSQHEELNCVTIIS